MNSTDLWCNEYKPSTLADLCSLVALPDDTVAVLRAQNNSPRDLLIIGPSGSGKTTLVELLISNQNTQRIDARVPQNAELNYLANSMCCAPTVVLEHVDCLPDLTQQLIPTLMTAETTYILTACALDNIAPNLRARFAIIDLNSADRESHIDSLTRTFVARLRNESSSPLTAQTVHTTISEHYPDVRSALNELQRRSITTYSRDFPTWSDKYVPFFEEALYFNTIPYDALPFLMRRSDPFLPGLLIIGGHGAGKTSLARLMYTFYTEDYSSQLLDWYYGRHMTEEDFEDIEDDHHFGEPVLLRVIDDVDNLTRAQQHRICAAIDSSAGVRWILTATSDSLLVKGLASRLPQLSIHPLKDREVQVNGLVRRLRWILEQECVKAISNDALRELVLEYYPDIRKAINELQTRYSSHPGTRAATSRQ